MLLASNLHEAPTEAAVCLGVHLEWMLRYMNRCLRVIALLTEQTGLCQDIVPFETFFDVIVVLNAVVLLLEVLTPLSHNVLTLPWLRLQVKASDDEKEIYRRANDLFLGFFVLEMALKMFAFGNRLSEKPTPPLYTCLMLLQASSAIGGTQ